MDDTQPSKNITSTLSTSSNTYESNLASMIAALVLFGFAMGAIVLNTYLERRKTVKLSEQDQSILDNIAYSIDVTEGKDCA